VSTGDSLAQRASDEFVAEFTQWRLRRGLSKKRLAAEMGFDPSYVSHVEAGRHRPTEDFARRAEAILETGGQLWRRFRAYDDLRTGERTRTGVPARDPPVPGQWLPPGTGLICEEEIARLSYVDGRYRCTIRRALYNTGLEPVTRYPIRIKVDRYPADPERSNRHHREHPLTWEELALVASCAGEPMTWRVKTDRDADKEIWLLFANERGHFTLYPGRRTTISYTYHVGADKWGRWFQRAIRLPTRRLTVEVDLPAALDPVVWGVETSLAAEAMPLRTPVVRHEAPYGRVVFSWHTDSPSLNALYRLEWRFGTDPDPDLGVAGVAGSAAGAAAGAPAGPLISQRMRVAGVVQRGTPVLTTPARRFDLPADAGAALEVVERLWATLARASLLYEFSKGAGLAAPQIGLGWAAAVIRPPESDGAPAPDPIVLLNPRVVATSMEMDDRYEGCLSFFDVRGVVSRALWIRVEHTLPTGERVVHTYRRGLARLVAHEIDHLEGRLYPDRMAPGSALLPLSEYEETGRPWQY
jgi:peptide deformylase